jgi:hypothetical protein
VVEVKDARGSSHSCDRDVTPWRDIYPNIEKLRYRAQTTSRAVRNATIVFSELESPGKDSSIYSFDPGGNERWSWRGEGGYDDRISRTALHVASKKSPLDSES